MRNPARGAAVSRLALGIAVPACLLLAAPGGATPFDYLTVGDPLESELRVLDLLDPAPLQGRILLPRLHTRPLQRFELQGTGAPPDLPPLYAISVARLERALARDALAGFAVRPGAEGTPRLIERQGGNESRLEISAALEGRGDTDEHQSKFAGGSGLHMRVGAGFDRWLVFSHLIVGRVEHARTFADPILIGNDLIAHTEESYLVYTGPSERWGFEIGRGRWHWGPGEESSLAMSRTTPPITGMAVRARMEALRLDAIALSATLRSAEGEQMAAHRLEWQPLLPLRLGLTEMVRYKAASWQPLYLAGVVPYILAQRLTAQDEPDSGSTLRNNILVGMDAAWRIAQGTRVYGELLVDDLHTRSEKFPDKLAWQLGLEGVGTEYTRIARFVYTSFFGRAFVAQGQAIGFVTGPDARRVRVRGTWDPGPAWQLKAVAALTDRGESGIDDPFVPGSPSVNPFDFLGTAERTRDFEVGLRWWPASGVDLTIAGGYRWIENQANVPGLDDRTPLGSLELRLTR